MKAKKQIKKNNDKLWFKNKWMLFAIMFDAWASLSWKYKMYGCTSITKYKIYVQLRDNAIEEVLINKLIV